MFYNLIFILFKNIRKNPMLIYIFLKIIKLKWIVNNVKFPTII